MDYMKGLFDDWQAQGHHLGPAREAGRLRQQHWRRIYGLAAKAEAEGVRILTGVEVTGFRVRREQHAR